jgi:hypothetical protein
LTRAEGGGQLGRRQPRDGLHGAACAAQPRQQYNGHPLYLYSADQKPGDTNAQGLDLFGGGWFALSAAGNMVSGTGTNGGASGY